MLILIYIPIFVKYHIASSMTNQLTLTISAILLFGYSFIKILIDFVVFKCQNWNSKIDIYKDLLKRDSKFQSNFKKYTETVHDKYEIFNYLVELCAMRWF